MNPKPLYVELARTVQARLNCIRSGNHDWEANHTNRLLDLAKEHLPSGSGIDCGTMIDLERSTGEKLVFTFGYHHMNDGGCYDGWTDHTLTVRPSLSSGFTLSISGRDRSQIKDYLHEVYHYALGQPVPEPAAV